MFFAQAIQALEESGVPYCVVGGLAVSLHGIPRTTFDLDIVVVPTVDALARLGRVLAELGLVPKLPITLSELSDPAVRSRLLEERNLIAVSFADPCDPLRELDVLVSPPVDAHDVVARAVLMPMGRWTVRVASVEDLVALKRAANRPQDLADVVHLERLTKAKP